MNWKIEIDLLNVSQEEAEGIFDRIADSVCGSDHGPEEDCPLDFVAGLHSVE